MPLSPRQLGFLEYFSLNLLPKHTWQTAPRRLNNRPGKTLVLGAGGGSDIYSAELFRQLISDNLALESSLIQVGTCRHAAAPQEMQRLTRLVGNDRMDPDRNLGLFRTTTCRQPLAETLSARPPAHQAVSMEEHLSTNALIMTYPRQTFKPLHDTELVNGLVGFYVQQGITQVYLVDTGADVLGFGKLEKQNQAGAVEGDVKAQVTHMRVKQKLNEQGYPFELQTIVLAPCIDGQTSLSSMIDILDQCHHDKKLAQISLKREFFNHLKTLTNGQDDSRTTRQIYLAYEHKLKKHIPGWVETKARRESEGQILPQKLLINAFILPADAPAFTHDLYGVHPNDLSPHYQFAASDVQAWYRALKDKQTDKVNPTEFPKHYLK